MIFMIKALIMFKRTSKVWLIQLNKLMDVKLRMMFRHGLFFQFLQFVSHLPHFTLLWPTLPSILHSTPFISLSLFSFPLSPHLSLLLSNLISSPHLSTPHLITSHVITSHHITSHHTSSHLITSHLITSHHISLHHITSHHITSLQVLIERSRKDLTKF